MPTPNQTLKILDGLVSANLLTEELFKQLHHSEKPVSISTHRKYLENRDEYLNSESGNLRLHNKLELLSFL